MINQLFERVVQPSDIQKDLYRFYQLVLETNAQQIIELGVRTGVSTCAWLAGLEKTGGKLWSCDIDKHSAPPQIIGHPQWIFVRGDDLKVDSPTECDILFIDTSHEYEHTVAELARYAPYVNTGGCIVMHDTSPLWPECRQATDEWIAANEPAKVFRHDNDHGLTIMWVNK